MSKPAKIAGEKPIGYRRNGIAIYRSSPRQAAIAKALAKTAQYTREAENIDAVVSGGIRDDR